VKQTLHRIIITLPSSPTIGSPQKNFAAHVSWKVQFNSHLTFPFFFIITIIFSPLSSTVLGLDEVEAPLANVIDHHQQQCEPCLS